MKNAICLPAAFALFASAAAPALAQDAPCGVTDAAALDEVGAGLQGSWVTEFKAGYVVAGPMVMPHPSAPAPETGRLEMRAARLTLVPDDPGGMILPLDWETQAEWSFDSQPSLPGAAGASNLPSLEIDDDAVAVLAGCPVNGLPRLIGTGSATMDGVSLTFTLRLMVVGADLIYGFQQVDGVARGQPMVERRPFVMSR